MIRPLFFPFFILALLLIHTVLAADDGKNDDGKNDNNTPAKKWKTLNGGEPIPIARGGFSGVFPESSQFANKMALTIGLPTTVLLCNLQLTKDNVGICLTDITLENSTTVSNVFPKGKKTHKVNGQDKDSWFVLDYSMDVIFNNLSLIQNVFSRPAIYDSYLPVSSVQDAMGVKPPAFWINVQNPTFYEDNKLSVKKYLEEELNLKGVNYISSPEIDFLKSMSDKAGKGSKLKLVFVFLEEDTVEPTSKKKYGEILKDLNSVKSFASGILVPKDYIWKVNKKTKYLEDSTTLVDDAHKLGLEVYASGFANDMFSSFNYTYDPMLEYLQFIDNGKFAVDGFMTDFPPTASEAIACFALNDLSKPKQEQVLVISSEGASGVYPGSTDLAYEQALEDGTDIIDCEVQISKDGTVFCLGAADLVGRTTAVKTFMSRSSSVKEIQAKNGIFAFDLTWKEIQSLKPKLFAEDEKKFPKNPMAENQGKLLTVEDFLELAKSKGATGVVLYIENVPYLQSKKGLDPIAGVKKALKDAGLDNQSTQQILISSGDTAVLEKFEELKKIKRIWRFEEKVSKASKKSVEELKKYADGVSVPRFSVISTDNGFTKSYTEIVKEFQDANLTVWAAILKNEYTEYAFDFFSDPILQAASYIEGAGVNGVVTEYPATVTRYLRSPCSDMQKNENMRYPILPTEPGGLLELAVDDVKAPAAAAAPAPALDVEDVVDPPLPPVTKASPPKSSDDETPADSESDKDKSSAITNVLNIGVSVVAVLLFSLFYM